MSIGEQESVIAIEGAKVAARLVLRDRPVSGRILFVNGAITTASALKWATRRLTEFELVTFDFPNVGESRPLNRTRTCVGVEAEAAVVTALINEYRPDYLISLSWGGTSALLALAASPPSVRRAIISSYSLGMTPAMRSLCESIMDAFQRGDREGAASLTIEKLGEHLPARLQRLFREYFLALEPEQDQYVLDHILYVSALTAESYRAELARIRIPLLFVNGSADRFTTPHSARLFSKLIPTARFACLPGAGHFLGNEGPAALEAVCRIIREYWAPELQPQPMIAAE